MKSAFRKSLLISGLGTAVLLAIPAAAQAGAFWQTRASISPGYYDASYGVEERPFYDANGDPLVDDNGDAVTFSRSLETSDFFLAADLGGTMGWAVNERLTLVADLEIEAIRYLGDAYYEDSDGESGRDTENNLGFDRTDFKASFGPSFNIGVNFTPFVGKRWGWQGDGYFDDKIWKEDGYFFGLAVSGVTFDAVDASFSTSVAYNSTNLDVAGGLQDTAKGLSVRIGMRPDNSRLSYSLKYQNFAYRSLRLEREDYLMQSITWYFGQGTL